MQEKTTEKLVEFQHPFEIGALVTPLEAGTYRLVVDEAPADGSASAAASSHLEIPALGHALGRSQYLQVTLEEIETALAKDARKGVSALS